MPILTLEDVKLLVQVVSSSHLIPTFVCLYVRSMALLLCTATPTVETASQYVPIAGTVTTLRKYA